MSRLLARVHRLVKLLPPRVEWPVAIVIVRGRDHNPRIPDGFPCELSIIIRHDSDGNLVEHIAGGALEVDESGAVITYPCGTFSGISPESLASEFAGPIIANIADRRQTRVTELTELPRLVLCL